MSMGDEARRLRDAESQRRRGLEEARRAWLRAVEDCAKEYASELAAAGQPVRAGKKVEVAVAWRFNGDWMEDRKVHVDSSGDCWWRVYSGRRAALVPLTATEVSSWQATDTYPPASFSEVRRSFVHALARAID